MPAEQLREGAVLNGRYRILRPLGHGGMGTVYLARHEQLDSDVAVKEIRGKEADAGEFAEAIDQSSKEAKFLSRLNHAHLPKVNDAFVEGQAFYLVMDYIEGQTLESKLISQAGKPMPVRDVVDIGLQVADVLSYLHGQEPPIIFRDLKPANIMLEPNGVAKLIDFGIARRFQPGASKDTMLLGSVGYSPPEQFGKHQTDSRSDIYALGATLHHLLTGRDPSAQPFKFPPVRSLNPAVPESLSQLIARCLAIDVEARPATAREVAKALLEVRDDVARATATAQGPGAAPGGDQVRGVEREITATVTTRDARGGRRAGVLLGAAAVIAAAGFGIWYVEHPRSRSATHPRQPVAPTPRGQPTGPNGGGTDAPQSTIFADVPDVTGDASKGYQLHFHLAGVLTTRPGTTVYALALLADNAGQPILARDRKDQNYATASTGQLCVQAAVTPDSEGNYKADLLLPAAAFPPGITLAQGLKYVVQIVDNNTVYATLDQQPLDTSGFPPDFIPPAEPPSQGTNGDPGSAGSGTAGGGSGAGSSPGGQGGTSPP